MRNYYQGVRKELKSGKYFGSQEEIKQWLNSKKINSHKDRTQSKMICVFTFGIVSFQIAQIDYCFMLLIHCFVFWD